MPSRHAASMFALTLVLGWAAHAVAQVADAPALATPQQAAALLNSGTVVVLHVGDKAEYEKEHLPQARHVDPRGLSAAPTPGQLTLQVPSAAELESRLEALGISDGTSVLVYMGKDAVSQATRVVFTLDHAGLGGRTFLLDGGLPAWKAAGLPLTGELPPAPLAGSLTVRPRPTSVASLDDVKATVGRAGHVVIDARAPEFYTGASDNNGRIPRPGHVRGAVNLPYTALLQEDGRFKTAADIEALLQQAGVSKSSRVTTYCHIGQQATVPWFMARLLGYDVRLFDGSYEEWARTPDVPVTTGERP